MKKDYLLKLLALSVFMLVAVVAGFADRFTPDPDKVTNSLNVRSAKSTQASILGTIKKGEYFEVVAIEDQWAQVDYKGHKGYVNVNYIKAAPQPAASPQSVASDDGFSFFGISFSGKYDVRWMFWVILGLIAIMVVCANKEDIDPLIPIIMMFAVSVAEIMYVIYVDSVMWPFTEPRWWWCAINFLLFAFGTVMQIATLISMATGMSDGKAQLGIYSVPTAIVVGIIFAFIDGGKYVPWVMVAFLVAQLIQAGIIFYEMRSNIGTALMCSITYLVGMAASLMMGAVLLAIVIIIAVALIVLMALGSGGGRDLHLRSLGGGIYEDQFGDRWRLR